MQKTLRDLQVEVDLLIKDFGGYWPPFAMLASITEEVGELAREINAFEGIKKKRNGDIKVNIGEELADTIFSLICVANHYKIDVTEEFAAVLNKYQIRDKDRFN